MTHDDASVNLLGTYAWNDQRLGSADPIQSLEFVKDLMGIPSSVNAALRAQQRPRCEHPHTPSICNYVSFTQVDWTTTHSVNPSLINNRVVDNGGE